jgi:hypothetical protein
MVAAAPSVLRTQAPRQPFYRKLWPGQLSAAITLPEPYEAEAFTLEGYELRIIKQGRTDALDSTSLARADAEKQDAHANVFTAAAALAFATGTIQDR